MLVTSAWIESKITAWKPPAPNKALARDKFMIGGLPSAASPLMLIVLREQYYDKRVDIMTSEQRQKLESALWNCANVLRGQMDPDEFRDYILGFIFYKYLSEKISAYADKILAQDDITFFDISEETAKGKEYLAAVKRESVEDLGYFLAPSELFVSIANRAGGRADGDGDDDEEHQPEGILDDLENAFSNIEKSTEGTDSEKVFNNLFDDIDLHSIKLGRSDNARNALISKILVNLQRIDFALADAKADVLGNAYEYLISKFAAGAGKTAGEFYTPSSVSTTIARLVTTGKKQLKWVYDPTCGSGSLLLRIKHEVKVKKFYGQERNTTTYNLARMNMILHGVHYSEFDIRHDDTLEDPRHMDIRYEAIVANPPFSAQWNARDGFKGDERFAGYGALAPKTKADYAFVQHMVHHLDDGGQMAVILPHGALFRGGAEGKIREHLITKLNYLDAVIGLPANIFFGTSIPACILVFKKCRESCNDILFIDASADFEKVKNKNELRDEHIDRIIDTYRARKTVKKYAARVSIKKIKANDYNLNIPRYVDTFEPEAEIDLNAVVAQISKIDKSMVETDKTIAAFCKELKIKVPV